MARDDKKFVDPEESIEAVETEIEPIVKGCEGLPDEERQEVNRFLALSILRRDLEVVRAESGTTFSIASRTSQHLEDEKLLIQLRKAFSAASFQSSSISVSGFKVVSRKRSTVSRDEWQTYEEHTGQLQLNVETRIFGSVIHDEIKLDYWAKVAKYRYIIKVKLREDEDLLQRCCTRRRVDFARTIASMVQKKKILLVESYSSNGPMVTVLSYETTEESLKKVVIEQLQTSNGSMRVKICDHVASIRVTVKCQGRVNIGDDRFKALQTEEKVEVESSTTEQEYIFESAGYPPGQEISPDPKKPGVVVIYSQSDKEIALKLTKKIELQRHTIWLQSRRSIWGNDFFQRIEQQFKAEIVVVCVSKSLVASYGSEGEKRFLVGEKKTIFVLMEERSEQISEIIPLSARQLNYFGQGEGEEAQVQEILQALDCPDGDKTDA